MVLKIDDIEDFEAAADDLRPGQIDLDGEGQRFCFDLLGDGRKWYLVITPSSVDVTVPNEGKPFMVETRLVAERLCRAISMMMEIHQYNKALEGEPEHE